jgi:polar amino acid transport system substrate-binding protein
MIHRFACCNRRELFHGMSTAILAATLPAGAFLGAGSPAQADGIQDIKLRGHMLVATEDDFRPFEFVEDGVSKGYDNDMLAEVKKQLPFRVEQQVIPWAGILPGVTTGKYDIAVTAVLVTDARKPVFTFAAPVAQSTTFFATKAGSSIKTGADLAGKTVGAQAGSAMLADLKGFDASLRAKGGPGIGKIVEYPSNPEAYQDLAVGRLDAVVNTEINLRSLIKERAGVFALGEGIAKPVYIAWAMKKGNAALAKVIDDAILAVKKSGKMAELQKKWFGTSFADLPDDVN